MMLVQSVSNFAKEKKSRSSCHPIYYKEKNQTIEKLEDNESDYQLCGRRRTA